MNRSVLLAAIVLWIPRVLAAGVVINEIHYEPRDKTRPEEFIELYNAGPVAQDLSGWFFSNGIAFAFPEGFTLASGAFAVVAEDPAALAAAFGFAGALGPYTGRLANEGELVILRDASGAIADRVDYGVGFPWPVAPAGRGNSMELLDPALDNDLGGSWRASGGREIPRRERVYFVGPQDPDWRYRKGTSEASTPPAAWREPEFVEDATWRAGQTPVGYGDGDDRTVLDDMQNGYSSIFLRHTFLVEEGVPASLKLRLYVDDGCIAWINGVEVARVSMAPGDHAHDSLAINHEAAWSEVVLEGPGSFVAAGLNVLAVHAFNTTLGSSDFSIDAELFVPGSEDEAAAVVPPSPGAPNSVLTEKRPPQIRQVRHEPQAPRSGEAITASARVTDPDGVERVELLYQVVVPGRYLPAFLPLDHTTLLADPRRPLPPNPEFEDPGSWTVLGLHDDGVAPDVVAGDGTYTGSLPPQENRTLLRYRLRGRDRRGGAVTVPYADDRSLNFALFVYDGVPPYVASARSVHPEGPGHTYGVEVMTALPVYFLITRAEDLSECIAYDGALQIPKSNEGARDKFNWEGAFVYEGEVYDHIRYRLRQANDRYGGSGKRSMRFRFNKGRHFQARDNYGRPYPARWRTLNTGKMFDNKRVGNFGLTETMNADLWNLVGVPAPWFYTFHLRVIDAPDEVPPGPNGQYLGDFWGMFNGIEDYDPRFLEAHGLPDGNLYKLKDGQFNGNDLKRNQGRFAVTTDEDFQNIRFNLRPERDDEWLDGHVSYDRWYSYHAVVEGVRHYDFRPADSHSKNRAWYFEPSYERTSFGRLWTLPWDSDASWGPNWNDGWDYSKNAIFANGGKPAFKQAYRNRLREFRDLVWTEEVIHRMIDDLAALVREFSMADRDRWRGAPPEAGSQDFGPLDAKVQDMRNFAFVGWSGSTGPTVPAGGRARYLENLAGAEGDVSEIPDTPSVTYAGPPGFPIDALVFHSTAFTDPQGDDTFAAMKWRCGEASDPRAPPPRLYEWPAVWESEEIPVLRPRVTVPPEVVLPGHRYRVRLKMKDTTGRWSHWSEPVELTAGEPTAPFPQEFLRITEIMYHPVGDSEFEFVEIQNRGGQVADLSAVRLSGGIEFSFAGSPVTLLGPGAFVVVAGNLAVFEKRYDLSGMLLAGEYTKRLGNGGERIVLSWGAGLPIQEVAYSDGWYPVTDGEGYSLVPLDPDIPPELWSQPQGWRPSTAAGGSPGADDLLPGGLQLPSDANRDGFVDLTDAVALLRLLFAAPAVLPCGDGTLEHPSNLVLLDANGDLAVDVSDAVYLLRYLFRGGPAPVLGTGCVPVLDCEPGCRF